ncbi:MAG: prolipoprotein diacylglyceryl transferase [Treponema sp.]|nr:prolipoprotein diacylglyceryl transferase [Treponema sp.]
MAYDATATRIFSIPPYTFFAVIGVVFASSLFILLLLKYGYNIPRYTKIFFISGIGILIGAKFFGLITGLYAALANKEPITIDTLLNTGIVFYGGLIGFLLSFLFICKIWNKNIEYRVVDLVVVCIPLFHFWGRLGCFFGGCCYGKETQSPFSVLYTNRISNEIITKSRISIQLFEAGINIVIFIFLLKLLNMGKFKEHLMKVYLSTYAILRIILELFRGDSVRGVWHGVSFSHVVSIFILMICFILFFTSKEKVYEC